jgi:hypothetical protein
MQIRPMQIDWREVVIDLRRLGMKNEEISKELGGYVSERQIRLFVEESQSPGHFRGEILLALWIQKTGRAADTAPRRPVSLRTMPSARTMRA